MQAVYQTGPWGLQLFLVYSLPCLSGHLNLLHHPPVVEKTKLQNRYEEERKRRRTRKQAFIIGAQYSHVEPSTQYLCAEVQPLFPHRNLHYARMSHTWFPFHVIVFINIQV